MQEVFAITSRRHENLFTPVKSPQRDNKLFRWDNKHSLFTSKGILYMIRGPEWEIAGTSCCDRAAPASFTPVPLNSLAWHLGLKQSITHFGEILYRQTIRSILKKSSVTITCACVWSVRRGAGFRCYVAGFDESNQASPKNTRGQHKSSLAVIASY